MKEKLKKISEIQIDKKIIYFLFPILIIISKFVRYTLMKEILVDNGIGHGYVSEILKGNITFSLDGSINVISLFTFINKIFNLSTYIEFEILISIIFNIILFFIIFKLNDKFNLVQAFFVVLSICVLNIFAFCLSKEPLQMLFFIAMYLVICCNRLSNKIKIFLITFIFILITLLVRKYYILATVFFIEICIIFILLNKLKIKNKNKICFLLVIFSILLLLIFCRFFVIDIYNELFETRARISKATSDIHVFSEIEYILDKKVSVLFMDYIVVALRLMIPIELIPLGIKYFPFVIYQLFITYFVIKSIKNASKNDENVNLSIYIYIAFLLVSSMFEPDYGSWIRHEVVVTPILFIISGAKTIKENSKKEEKNG